MLQLDVKVEEERGLDDLPPTLPIHPGSRRPPPALRDGNRAETDPAEAVR
jgi:hypothetical protein